MFSKSSDLKTLLSEKRSLLADLARRFAAESRGLVLLLACLAGIAGGAIASLMGRATVLIHHLLFSVPEGERLSGAYLPRSLDILLWLIVATERNAIPETLEKIRRIPGITRMESWSHLRLVKENYDFPIPEKMLLDES